MDPFAVVVYGYRQLLFGGVLADYVLVKEFLYFQRLRDLIGSSDGRLYLIVLQNRVTYGYTLIADIRPRIVAGGRDELSNNILTLMAKRTA
jgi:hypothetical protein